MLKLVKTARRSISGQDDNLNAFFCLILSYKLVHDDEVDLDAVIRAWSQRKKRRIAFAFPFQMIIKLLLNKILLIMHDDDDDIIISIIISHVSSSSYHVYTCITIIISYT